MRKPPRFVKAKDIFEAHVIISVAVNEKKVFFGRKRFLKQKKGF